MQFVGVLIRRGHEFASAIEDECGSGMPDLELRQKTREPRVFDDNGKNALPLLIDVDWTGKCDRRLFAGRMVADLEPLGLLGLDSSLEPGPLGDPEIGRLESAIGAFDV